MTASIRDSRLPRRRVLAGAGGTLLAASVAAACGSDSTTSTRSAQSTTAPVSGTVAAASTPANLPAEFVVANEIEPSDLSPYAGAGYGGWLVTMQIYETLMETRLGLNRAGTLDMTFTPHLALSFEHPDPLRWVLKLRPNVTFHNGEAWNGEAARISAEIMADAKQAASLSKVSYLGRNLERVEVVDASTIAFVTKNPDEETLRQALRIGFVGLPPKLSTEKGVQTFFENPVGTGPYKLKDWTRGQQIRLEKYSGHWNQNGPTMQSVRFIARPQAAVRAQTVKAGEAHFAYNIGAEQAQGIKNTVIGGGFQSSGIRLNNAHPVTGDVRVRKALNYALDRAAIAKSIFRGSALPIAFFGFQPVKLEPFAYKPDEAKKLIDAAGARGTQLEFVYGETRIPEEDQLAEVYKASFDAIGLRVTLRKLEPKQYNELGGKPFPEQPPLYMETTSSGNFGEIAGGLADKYGCKGTGTFCNPSFDAEFAHLATITGDARNAKLQSIAERLHNDETPRVWVAAVQQVHGFADFVKPNLPANAWILFEDIKLG